MKKQLLMACLLIAAVACEDTADSRQREQTKHMMAQADMEIGMPDIINWAERRNAKTILELRDKEITTFAYIVALDGSLLFLGEAVGYGLPYSVQFTNPERKSGPSSSAITLPQPDPNGLFMPEGLSATWIMLRDPESKEVRPVYVEPEIVVSPFPLKYRDSYQ